MTARLSYVPNRPWYWSQRTLSSLADKQAERQTQIYCRNELKSHVKDFWTSVLYGKRFEF